MEIDKGRGNAVKILNRVLIALEACGARLSRLDGGNKRNAIPREASAVVYVPPARLADARAIVAAWHDTARAELGSVEVARLFDVEPYPTLLQMTSTVTARCREPLSRVLAALFPCASVTGAPKARIGVDLWPDASEAQLRNYFHRSLHFARRALGNPEAILFDGMGYRPGRGLALAYDVASFEEGVAETQALGPPGAMAPERRAAAAALLSRTLALWRGDYLEDLDAGEWAVLRREELRITRLQALLDLGQLHLLDAGYDAAASVYRSLLAEDPYLELAQRELMRCLARQGEGARALRLYHELRDLLGRELGAEPSYETTILFERIRRGDDV